MTEGRDITRAMWVLRKWAVMEQRVGGDCDSQCSGMVGQLRVGHRK